MSKKLICPSTTKVMEALAKSKNIGIKELMLKFAKLYVMDNNTKITTYKRGNIKDNYYIENIFPENYKYDRITYNIMKLEITADDFSFFLNAKGFNSKIKPYGNDPVETNRDLSIKWRKMLCEFNKPALIAEVKRVAEYNKQVEIQKFIDSLKNEKELTKIKNWLRPIFLQLL